ncbi:hypothetical protein LINGRAHAP2_LOCUS33126 [Linum grandiflorum]
MSKSNGPIQRARQAMQAQESPARNPSTG